MNWVSKAAPSINKTPIPKRNFSWSNDTKLPTPNENKDSDGFQLGMELIYHDGQGKNLPVVYKGANADGLLHTARLEDGSKITVHNSNLQLLDQPDFSNLPKTPLDYQN